MTRSGVRVCDIFDEPLFEEKFRRIVFGMRKRFGDLLKDYNEEDELARFRVCDPIATPTLTNLFTDLWH